MASCYDVKVRFKDKFIQGASKVVVQAESESQAHLKAIDKFKKTYAKGVEVLGVTSTPLNLRRRR